MSPEEHNVLMTEPPDNRREKREHMTEIMFEVFNVRSFYSKCSNVLSILSNGRTTGLVVESGEALTSVVPIFEC